MVSVLECTTQVSFQENLLFQENWEPHNWYTFRFSSGRKRRPHCFRAAARQRLSMSKELKMLHFCPVCSSFTEKPFSGSLHRLSQSSSTTWVIPVLSFLVPYFHRCQICVLLWKLFPPLLSPPFLTPTGIYHNKSHLCLIVSWCLLLRWCEQTTLVLRVVQEKKQKDRFRDWLTCCLTGKEKPFLRKIQNKKWWPNYLVFH